MISIQVNNHNTTMKSESIIRTQPAKEIVIGYWKSSGSANGREVFLGPQGGMYRYTNTGGKVYIQENQRGNILQF
jgi:hypothetical protein